MTETSGEPDCTWRNGCASPLQYRMRVAACACYRTSCLVNVGCKGHGLRLAGGLTSGRRSGAMRDYAWARTGRFCGALSHTTRSTVAKCRIARETDRFFARACASVFPTKPSKSADRFNVGTKCSNKTTHTAFVQNTILHKALFTRLHSH